MRRSLLGSFVSRFFTRLPKRRRFLARAVRAEGGEMFSLTLREVLRKHYGIEVGPYTYGSLLHHGHCDAEMTIGSYVSIGPGVRRFGAAHPLDGMTMHPFWYNERLGYVDASHDVERTPCVIEHDVWIGANAVILPGCRRIGVGAVIGAGAVVTRDVEDFAVVAGNPARVIKMRLDAETRGELLSSRYWTKTPSEVTRILDDVAARFGPSATE